MMFLRGDGSCLNVGGREGVRHHVLHNKLFLIFNTN